MTHRNLVVALMWFLYYGLAAYSLHVFEAGLLISNLVLFGLPALLLIHFTVAPSQVLVAATAFGFGLGVLLEGVAGLYGLWYNTSASSLQLFSVLAPETVLVLTLQVLFLVIIYEVLFDDIEYTLRRARERLAFFMVFAVAALGLITLHYLLAPTWQLSYSYLWVVGSLVFSALAVLSLHKRLSVRLFDKAIDFSLAAVLPLGLSLWLMLENGLKVFPAETDYLARIYFFGHTIPLEEVVLLFTLPFLVAIVYEMYLDDRKVSG